MSGYGSPTPPPTPPSSPQWSAPAAAPPVQQSRHWLKLFLIGLALWAATVIVTFFTDNSNLVPTIVLLGSFLVPGTFVVWAYERYAADVGPERIAACFGIGGIIGVLGASVLETYLLSPSIWMYLGVGLIEEAVKLAALIMVARRIPVAGLRHGLVLGATVGAGFAAFESAGYAFNAVLSIHGLALKDLVETEILRGVLAPVGHILWTAIMGGVLFRERRDGRFRFNAPVILTYLGVSLLHALWDSTSGIAVWLVARTTTSDFQRAIFELGYMPDPTSEQVHLYTLYDTLGLIVVSLGGLIWLRALISRNRAAAPAD
ncbi:RsiW-degrading membrane proteinase PrsW (M82 family) [Kitasatospora gansuensis]|uniref:RsiW-degrading membrane proteinase PrsW (M82 family) n=1 Tax=Kitasatospora gansuensis TaxID=258050 RepID=A0A7W7WHF4_9ACTN|nr:PrsW family glutamic-type intramembrane protease [Kitasatospora gansuensis]MBB4946469.1 RsiW-degrading membrane proteinase PrsW (M82 family) [Kitasatospora gansuensis]